uniref:Uncharacterized protein n=1 Tax=Oryza meridionalis TaxID=40149 RepID=A0A0E0DCN7_9ORYZ
SDPQDVAVANTLLAISSTTLKLGSDARGKKKKGRSSRLVVPFRTARGPTGHRLHRFSSAVLGGGARLLRLLATPKRRQGLAAHLSAKKSALKRLDGYRLRLRKAKDDLPHKEDVRRVVADTLRRANAENRSLRADLEAVNRRGTERDRQLAAAEERIKSLETRLISAETAALTLGPTTESAKQACYTLRLALNDLGARAEDAPGVDGTAFDFSEWTQEAAGSVVEVAGAHEDYYARVSVGFVLSLLHAHGCEHIRDVPHYVREEWPSKSQHSGAALKAIRKGF